MSKETQIHTLAARLRKRVRGLEVEVDGPSRTGKVWFLRLGYEGLHYVIEYIKGDGYGLSSVVDDNDSQAPDEVFSEGEEEKLVRRVAALCRQRMPATPNRGRLLNVLRSWLGLSQTEMARVLNVRQPTLSKLERSQDLSLAILERSCRAVHGSVYIHIVVPEKGVLNVSLQDMWSHIESRTSIAAHREAEDFAPPMLPMAMPRFQMPSLSNKKVHEN